MLFNTFKISFQSLVGKLFPIIWLDLVWILLINTCVNVFLTKIASLFLIRIAQEYFENDQLKPKSIWIYPSYLVSLLRPIMNVVRDSSQKKWTNANWTGLINNNYINSRNQTWLESDMNSFSLLILIPSKIILFLIIFFMIILEGIKIRREKEFISDSSQVWFLELI